MSGTTARWNDVRHGMRTAGGPRKSIWALPPVPCHRFQHRRGPAGKRHAAEDPGRHRSAAGVTGVGIYELDKTGPVPILLRDADRQMAIGSTEQALCPVRAGARDRGGQAPVERCRAAGCAVPSSGTMQEWPEQAPVTLQTLVRPAGVRVGVAGERAVGDLGRVERCFRAASPARRASRVPAPAER